MTLVCNLNHYTLNTIPEHRLEFIELKLAQFIKKNSIKKWPIDCVSLLKELRDSGKMPLILVSVPVTSSKFDAQARYYPDRNVYMFLVNKAKIKYPFKSSKDRRLNFTLAHEIGHVALGHLDIPDHLKTKKDRDIEEQEANEFAGRFLVPRKKLLSCNFTSYEKVAEYFNISKQALWKRLNHLQRLDLLKSMPLNVCQMCGNKSISAFSDFCCICGAHLFNNNRGIEIMIYDDGYDLDNEFRFQVCPKCSNEEKVPKGKFCRICSTYLVNECTNNYECGAYAQGNARYCEFCGSETAFLENGYLLDWKEVKEEIFEADEVLSALEEASAGKDFMSGFEEDDDDCPF